MKDLSPILPEMLRNIHCSNISTDRPTRRKPKRALASTWSAPMAVMPPEFKCRRHPDRAWMPWPFQVYPNPLAADPVPISLYPHEARSRRDTDGTRNSDRRRWWCRAPATTPRSTCAAADVNASTSRIPAIAQSVLLCPIGCSSGPNLNPIIQVHFEAQAPA
jgi:hypothetical protein